METRCSSTKLKASRPQIMPYKSSSRPSFKNSATSLTFASTPFAVSTSHRAPRSCRQDGPYDRYPVCDLCIRPDDLDHRHHSRIWTLPGCAVVRIDRHALLRRLWRQDREMDQKTWQKTELAAQHEPER